MLPYKETVGSENLACRSHKKNGPPKMAVMTPTGISVGGNKLRAKVSHSAKNNPPNKNVAGVKYR